MTLHACQPGYESFLAKELPAIVRRGNGFVLAHEPPPADLCFAHYSLLDDTALQAASAKAYEQTRTIWMDGRPHPSEYAPHTFMGFSTGEWEGNMLTVTTTHVKQGWHRRENIPASDEVTVIEHYFRHGSMLTHISIAEDPIFLAEPLIKSEDFNLVPDPNNFNPFYPCEPADEGEFERGTVPSYFAGENPYVSQYAAEHNLPQAVTLGGPETMYPEYREKMKGQPVAVYPATAPPR